MSTRGLDVIPLAVPTVSGAITDFPTIDAKFGIYLVKIPFTKPFSPTSTQSSL